jgi:uncharacterized protein YqeY
MRLVSIRHAWADIVAGQAERHIERRNARRGGQAETERARDEPLIHTQIGEGGAPVNDRDAGDIGNVSAEESMAWHVRNGLPWDSPGVMFALPRETRIMRERLAGALKDALKAQDKRRISTIRLIQAAVNDRDIANRGAGKDPVSDEEIMQILSKMMKQREESAKIFEEGGRIELAEQEREEIGIIRDFLPKQLAEEQVKQACAEVVRECGADGLRDMGRCMSALKEKFPGRMDFGKASGIVKGMLQ